MATTATLKEVPYDSFSENNGVATYTLAGASGAGGTATVKAAVTSAQIWGRGHIRVSGATTIYLKSAAAGTIIAALDFELATTKVVPSMTFTKAGELLELYSSANVTIEGELRTMPVYAGQALPPEWKQ